MRQILNDNQISLGQLINVPLQKLDKSNKDYDKKVLEICHTGKFLMLLTSDFHISEVRERPDFIIESDDGSKIGLEHEILVDPIHKKIEGSFSDLVKTTERLFRERHPETKLLVNISVNTTKKLSKRENPILVERLLSMIEDAISNTQFEENDLVYNISCHKHSKLIFNTNTGAWWQRSLHTDIVAKSIRKKEQKRLSYIKNTGLNEQWLLIVVGSLSHSSYELDSEFDRNFKMETGFSRVFLMEDFNARLFEI
ncbi:MAG: hypothetical protein IH595_01180 [Bacteroidales bacterium]|nr:hypothetical protein [Bacteroidales bacterium]